MSGEILPNDNQTNTTRSGFSILHNQVFLPRVIGNLNLNKVSDNTYFTDLSARLALTAQTYLPREGSLGYYGQGYSLVARAQAFQTLQDPLNPVVVPYFRLPQITFNAVRYDTKGFDLAWNSDFTRFSSSTQVMGNRLVINPSVSYPLITPGAYITPKLSMHATRYHLEEVAAWQTGVALPSNAQSFITRNVPIFSLDSGMTFERKTSVLGQNYTQTIEPRLYYLRVPYRDQSNIPIFDTALADFNFSQIFSENIYSGSDRIADANQLTFAVSTRLLNDNGGERFRATFGQRYYFTSQQVTLPTETTPRVDKTSDLLAAISGEILPNLRLDSALQYSPNQKQIQRVSHGVRWNPEPGNTVSAAYRYQRDLLEQVDFAAQWRLSTRWYGVGRYNYSIRDGRVVEALGGFEYDGGCWVGRVVVQRYALATQKASTSIFFQIELNGLSRLGSNPLEVLRRNIPGYSKLNENQAPQPRTFNNYE
jgi:LPS-assembly protein